MKLYPHFIPYDLYAWFKEIVKMSLFESNRVEKYLYILKGFAHFLIGKYGRLNVE